MEPSGFEIKISEINHGSLRLVRKCRVVTYLMGTDQLGREKIVCEIEEDAASKLITAVAEANENL